MYVANKFARTMKPQRSSSVNETHNTTLKKCWIDTKKIVTGSFKAAAVGVLFRLLPFPVVTPKETSSKVITTD